MSSDSPSQERVFLARNDSIDSDLAVTALKHAAGTGSIGYAFSVAITPLDWNAAHAVGLARTEIAKARGRTGKTYRRGDDDERIDTEGALAELAVFGVVGKTADSVAPLVEYKPSRKDSDFVAEGWRYDVKSVSQSKARVCVNRASHFEKKPDAYVLGKIVSEAIVDVYAVGGDTVETWRVFTGFTPYYAASMPPVIPLPETAELDA